VGMSGTWYIMNAAVGWLDDFRIYDKILSSVDATFLYNNPGVAL